MAAINFPDSPSTGDTLRAPDGKTWYYSGSNWAVANSTANAIATMITANAAYDRLNATPLAPSYFLNVQSQQIITFTIQTNHYAGPLNISGNARIRANNSQATIDAFKLETSPAATGNVICLEDNGGNTLYAIVPNGWVYSCVSPGSSLGNSSLERQLRWHIVRLAADEGNSLPNSTVELALGAMPAKAIYFEFWGIYKPPSGSSTANGINMGTDHNAGFGYLGEHNYYPLTATSFHHYASTSNSGARVHASANTSTTQPPGNCQQLAVVCGTTEITSGVDLNDFIQMVIGSDTTGASVVVKANSFLMWTFLN